MNSISRNAICPCGSGKKYKKCCLAKDEATRKPLILMPVRDSLEPETAYALEKNISFAYQLFTEVGLPVDEARNRLARRALVESDASIVLWIDADAFWTPGILERLLRSAKNAAGVVGAVYSQRRAYGRVNAWRTPNLDAGMTAGEIRHKESLVPCFFVGSHVMAHSRDVLDRLGPDPWTLTDTDMSEDAAFARRVRDAGLTEYLDPKAFTFHVEDGSMFLPGAPAYELCSNGAIRTREIVPTLPFAKPRDYGPTVNAARVRTFDAAGVDTLALRGSIDTLFENPNARRLFLEPSDEELMQAARGVLLPESSPINSSVGLESLAKGGV